MENQPAAAPNKRRWFRSRFGLILGAVVLVLAVPFGKYGYDNWQLDRDLAAAIAETDGLDPGWRYQAMQAKRAKLPDRENGALQLLKILETLKGLSPNDPIFKLPPPEGVKAGSREHLQWIGDVQESIASLPAAAQLNDQQIAALESAWKDWQQGYEESRALRKFTRGRSDTTSTTDLLNARLLNGASSASRLLWLDVHRFCQDEQFASALRSCEAAFAVARLMRDEPFEMASADRAIWLSYACDSVQRALGQGVFNEKNLEALQVSVQDEERFNHMEAAIRAQRANSWEYFVDWQRGRLGFDQRREYENPSHVLGAPLTTEPAWYHTWLPAWNPNEPRIRMARALRRFNRWLAFSKKPLAEQFAEFTEFEKQQNENFHESPHDLLMGWQAPRAWIIRMRLSTTATALALERYRQVEGAWPESLDQLIPRYLPAVPEDFYSRKPLTYRRVDGGVLVYSVGPDRVDDGGKMAPFKGAFEQFGPINMDRLDIGMRLWDAEKRRQPALPPVAPRAPNAGPR